VRDSVNALHSTTQVTKSDLEAETEVLDAER